MTRISVKCLGPCVCLFVAFSGTRAQKESVIPLVSSRNWRLAGSQELGLEAIRKYGGDPVIEREYGLRSLGRQIYTLNNISAEVIVEQLPDASAAYGLLTFYRTQTMVAEEGMPLTLNGPEGAFIARDHFFIRIPRPSQAGASASEFHALITSLSGSQPSSVARIKLPAVLPPTGLISGTEKYVLGLEAARRLLPSFRSDLIGFSQGAEMQLADYAMRKDRMTVLALAYPTPQIARRHFDLMEKLLVVNQEHRPGLVKGRRQGSFVFLVLNSDSIAAANHLLDEIKVSTSVSWDRPYPGDKPFSVQVAHLYLANFLFSVIGIGFAILVGILVALFRKFMARLYPDSFWAQPVGGTIIRLDLSYK